MKRLIVLILVAAVLWAGYWFYGASSTRTTFQAWLADRQAAGWEATVGNLEVKGFPNRFDTTFTDIALADPAAGWAWRAPFLQLLALSYKPNHVIAVWPQEQRIVAGQAAYDVIAAALQASLVLRPSTDLVLDRIRLVGESLQITGEDGAGLAIGAARLAGERLGADGAPTTSAPADGETRYRLAMSVEDLQPDDDLRAQLDPSDSLPRRIETLRADVTIGFDRPWDRGAVEAARPQPTSLSLRLAEADWGPLRLMARGDLQLDGQGWPTGQIDIKASNWREMMRMLRAAGVVSAEWAGTLEQGLSLMAGQSEDIDIPLAFRNGRIWIGPVPLMDSPRVILR